MDLGRLCIENRLLGWLIIVVLVTSGLFSFEHIGRYEDPEFTIKDAKIITKYPGASPLEVEQEVTERIETAAQQLSQVKYVTSVSTAGISDITVTIKDKYDKYSLPQVWDELRRKVNDIQSRLPPGAGPSIVNDDYGDVYGIYLALTGAGFSFAELKEVAKNLKKELLLVPGVAKVLIKGTIDEQIFIELSQSKLAQFNISTDTISNLLKTQNQVTPSGVATIGKNNIRIQPSGELNSVEAIADLLIPGTIGNSFVYLKDVGTIERGYEEFPQHFIRFNGEPALTIGVSMVAGGNIVKLGVAVTEKLVSMKDKIPAGIKITPIYYQPHWVDKSIQGFVINLVEALVIVVGILLIFMGMRSGILIGITLLLIVLGTITIMYLFNINLQRISLGALIIALGMLVDNALVIVDGILVGSQRGMSIIDAAEKVVKQVMWPLFGATTVGILAFSGIGLSQDKTGEYVISLFQVILISLLLSWFIAVTVTPMLADLFFKPQKKKNTNFDPYTGTFYKQFRKSIVFTLKHRIQALFGLGFLLILSISLFHFIPPGFFPNSTTPIFYVDYWREEGTDITQTVKDVEIIEKQILKVKGVKQVTSFIGEGATRFMLVYTPEAPNSSYAQLAIETKDFTFFPDAEKSIREYISTHFPNSNPKYKYIMLGPSKDGKIEVRVSGSNSDILRQISSQIKNLMYKDFGTESIRDNWRQKVIVSRPIYSEPLARATGITRSKLSEALQMTFSGLSVGLYREMDEMIPIVMRLPAWERNNINSMYNLFIWSPISKTNVPIQQVVKDFQTTWEDSRIHRRDRKRTITPSADPVHEPTGRVFDRLRSQIGHLQLPGGYELAWGGEFESQSDAQMALAAKLPISFLLMILVVILIFGKVRQSLIIWLTVPLSIIGVTIGLLLARMPFDFMALLGFLSLTGMLIKNGIVLIDEIDIEISEGKERFKAVVDSSISRARPVSMAALTTIMGVAPLLFDPFFASMAVLIMFGLAFATILTLFVVPILYTLLFNIHYDPEITE
ncbi:MAG: efflux RND transporter permease subunit [Alphaproteobacteria bacterium]|nr:efflux RND transporter permease subunit [Alphaproteobacteria bacterium]